MVGNCIPASDFEAVAELYDQIRTWNEQQGTVDDDLLASAFDQQLKAVMDAISASGSGKDSLKAMSSLYELCFDKWAAVMGDGPMIMVARSIWESTLKLWHRAADEGSDQPTDAILKLQEELQK